MIELMVSMVIFLVAIAAIYGVTKIASIQKTAVAQKTDAMKGARIALSYVRRDALNAGLSYHRIGGIARDNFASTLMNLPTDSDTDWDLLTGILGANNRNTNTFNGSDRTDTIAFAYRDFDFNDGNKIAYTSTTTSGTTVNVNTAASAANKARAFDLYLFETGTTQVVGMATNVTGGNLIQLAVGDPLGINQAGNGTGNNRSLLATNTGSGILKKFNWVSYSVTNDGVLIRKSFGNKTGLPASQQIETRELVYGVKDMQIKYLLNDGTTTDDPSSNNNTRANQSKMNQIVQIEVTLTILQTAEDGITQTTPVTIKEVISTRNLRYDVG